MCIPVCQAWLITWPKTVYALSLARNIVGNLNQQKHPSTTLPRKNPRPPKYDAKELYGIIPTDTRKPFDIREIIARIVDGSEFDDFKARFGTTLVCGFAHIEGMPVGIIANNGILFGESAQKKPVIYRAMLQT